MAHDAAVALGQVIGIGRRQLRRAFPGDVLQQLVQRRRLTGRVVASGAGG